jgi:hypothetical protein
MMVTSISFALVTLGVLLLLSGIVLVVKHVKIAGIIITLLGLVVVAVPVLTYLYIALSMR